jgi:hypothetical protein
VEVIGKQHKRVNNEWSGNANAGDSIPQRGDNHFITQNWTSPMRDHRKEKGSTTQGAAIT